VLARSGFRATNERGETIEEAIKLAFIRSTSLFPAKGATSDLNFYYALNIESLREKRNAISSMNWVNRWDAKDRDCLDEIELTVRSTLYSMVP